MGSLIMPSDRAALYTIKPTLKLIAQDGIIPITHEADSAGPMTKSVKDLANLLDVLVDPNYKNVPEGGYISAATGDWGDIRIGIVEPEKWLFPEIIVKYEQSAMDQMASPFLHGKIMTGHLTDKRNRCENGRQHMTN
jgi:amidase